MIKASAILTEYCSFLHHSAYYMLLISISIALLKAVIYCFNHPCFIQSFPEQEQSLARNFHVLLAPIQTKPASLDGNGVSNAPKVIIARKVLPFPRLVLKENTTIYYLAKLSVIVKLVLQGITAQLKVQLPHCHVQRDITLLQEPLTAQFVSQASTVQATPRVTIP